MARITKVSPFAPASLPRLPAVAGVRIGACESAAGYAGRLNLMLAVCDPGTTVAGCLTQSRTASAPVAWCRRVLGGSPELASNGAAGDASGDERAPTVQERDVQGRALVVNAGNANAFTGTQGDTTVNDTVAIAAELVGCSRAHVLVASTGVIAEPLASAPFRDALPDLHAKLTSSAAPLVGPGADDETTAASAWLDAAAAIMTTDTFAKLATRRVDLDGTIVTLNGIAKGSGMIAPDMATMLAFVFTDATVPADTLAALTRAHCETTFNAITVDSDTSTSDTLLVFATGAAGAPPLQDLTSGARAAFEHALQALFHDLAQAIITDGEGISKLIEVRVTGAVDDASAKRIALAIANSPLVKTAVAGGDPNWGRIVMAVGKAGEPADRDRLAISIGGIAVTRDGARVADYDEAPLAEHMRGERVVFGVDLGMGDGGFTAWGCDLTTTYIDINADYRS